MLRWSELERVAEETINTHRGTQVFLAFPYRAEHARGWHAMRAPLEHKFGIQFRVSDGGHAVGGLLYKIVRDISSSGLCIFDLTGNNPNVAIELGIAIALGKPYKLVRATSDDSPLPVDVQGQDCLPFSSEGHLQNQLDAFFSEVFRVRQNRWTPELRGQSIFLDLARRRPSERFSDTAENIAARCKLEVEDVMKTLTEQTTRFATNDGGNTWHLKECP